MGFSGQKIARNMFGLDYRSLALLRIGLGVILLINLFITIPDLRALYTDEGVLPRLILLSGPDLMVSPSLYLASGDAWYVYMLFVIQIVLAVLFLVGYRTHLVGIASYILLLSLQARNPLLLFGADMTLRLGMFWALFLPIGRRYSLDAMLGRVEHPERETYLGIPGVAYIGQVAMIYVFSGLLKTGDTWHVDHTAVYYSLALDMYTRPLGHWLNQFDGLTTWLTISVYYLEIYGPLLFILPVWSGWGRLLGFVIFAVLQIGFNLCLQLGLFGAVMIVCMFGLLPAEFWAYLGEPVIHWLADRAKAWSPVRLASAFENWRQRGRERAHALAGLPSATNLKRKSAAFLCLLRDSAALFLVIYVLFWNIATYPGKESYMPDKYVWIGQQTGLYQLYNLFSPDPQADDGWIVIRGTLKNGRQINAFTGEPTVTTEPPADMPDSFGYQHMGRYVLFLLLPNEQMYFQPFLQYLEREWNRAHPAPQEQIATLEFFYLHEVILKP